MKKRISRPTRMFGARIMPPEKYIGFRVKELRNLRKLTQKELAELAGVPFATINRLERGKANPTLTTLSKILEVFSHCLKVERKETGEESKK